MCAEKKDEAEYFYSEAHSCLFLGFQSAIAGGDHDRRPAVVNDQAGPFPAWRSIVFIAVNREK
jgi:hypothetical protein